MIDFIDFHQFISAFSALFLFFILMMALTVTTFVHKIVSSHPNTLTKALFFVAMMLTSGFSAFVYGLIFFKRKWKLFAFITLLIGVYAIGAVVMAFVRAERHIYTATQQYIAEKVTVEENQNRLINDIETLKNHHPNKIGARFRNLYVLSFLGALAHDDMTAEELLAWDQVMNLYMKNYKIDIEELIDPKAAELGIEL